MTFNMKRALCSVAAIALMSACGNGADNHAEIGAAAAQPDAPATASTVSAPGAVPKGQLPEGVTPTAYRIDLRADPTADTFTGSVEIDVTLDEETSELFLHALGPDVTSAMAVYQGDIAVAAVFEGDLAEGGVSRLVFSSPIPAGEATLRMDYTAPFNLGLAGLYKASQGGLDYLATQMEPIDARRAFPSFDEPRFKTPWTISVTTPADNKVIANGPEVSAEVQEDGWVKHQFATTRPIQSYLVALAVGPYEEFPSRNIPANTIRDREIVLRSYAAKGKRDQLETSHEATFEMLRIQEEYFNYPYPYAKLDLIAAPDFAYGAMENAGAIIYRESALLINDRTSLGQKRGALTTHAHELAHQWFGNLVTPKWWNDIWLNEAFATWMSYKTMHAYDPDGGFDRSPIQRGIGAMGADSLASARQIRNPINANGDILSAFDGITYSKGGHVLSMFENYLGEDAFREGIRLHMTRFEDGVADVNDFMTSLAEGSGDDGVVDSFKSFIFQPGTPFLNVQMSCAEGREMLEVRQSRYAPLGSSINGDVTWSVPFAVTLGYSDRTERISEILTDYSTRIALPEGCPDYIMPNADGAGYWRFTLSDGNWKALADNFDRLSGGEQMMFADSLVAAFRAGEVSAEAMLAGLAATPSGEWDAASIPLGRLSGLIGVLEEKDQPAMRKWIADAYANQWEYLNSRTAAQLSQGDILLRERIYSICLEHGGGACFAKALAFAKASQNQRERRAIFNILAGGGSLEDVTALLDDAFTDEFQGQEALFMYYSAIGNDDEAVEAMGWERFRRDFEKLLERVPEIRKPQMAGVAGSFCEDAKTDEAEAFIKSKADLIPGYERPLAQAVEGARLCAALVEAKRDELAAALK